jgi:hypothetical protein
MVLQQLLLKDLKLSDSNLQIGYLWWHASQLKQKHLLTDLLLTKLALHLVVALKGELVCSVLHQHIGSTSTGKEGDDVGRVDVPCGYGSYLSWGHHSALRWKTVHLRPHKLLLLKAAL